MKKKIEELKPEIVEKQKEELLNSLTTLKLQYEFRQDFWEKKAKEAKGKEENERIAHLTERDLSKYRENITDKEAYYTWLESLDMDSAQEEKQKDTSK